MNFRGQSDALGNVVSEWMLGIVYKLGPWLTLFWKCMNFQAEFIKISFLRFELKHTRQKTSCNATHKQPPTGQVSFAIRVHKIYAQKIN